MYRSPVCSLTNFIFWCSLIHINFFKGRNFTKLIIVGDFNFPHFNSSVPYVIGADANHIYFLFILHQHRLSQLNLTPTRDAIIPDFFITNFPDKITNLSLQPPLAPAIIALSFFLLVFYCHFNFLSKLTHVTIYLTLNMPTLLS